MTSTKIIGIIRIKINTDNSQNENYQSVKADLFIKLKTSTKTKSQLRIVGKE
jgi:hypothetical protein